MNKRRKNDASSYPTSALISSAARALDSRGRFATSGLADVLAEALTPIADRLRAAFVFGSLARGRETSGSDVDLLLVGDVSFREAVACLYPAQSQLGREINAKVFTAKEFASKAKKEAFLVDVLAKPKIFVIGNADELAQLDRRQPRNPRAAHRRDSSLRSG